MKNIKKILAVTLASTCLFGSVQNVFACTGVIVGKDLTTDGSFIYGRTEDYERNRTKRLVVHPAGEFKKGDKLVDSNNGFEFIHPEDSVKFFSTPDSTQKPEDMEKGVYDAAGYNEYGLGAFCTVSANYSDEIKAVDPYIKNGINEASMSTFILAHAKSARGAIELLAKTIDEKGASMGDIVVFGDHDEVWYMEIYSGHQYVAIKYPADKFSVFPNAFWLGGVDLNDKENVIASKDIVKVAKDAKTYTETKDGLMDLAASYAPKKLRESNRSRMWSGVHSLDPNSKIKYDAERFELMNDLSKDSEKIDIKDVLAFTRNRFEGTDFKASENRKLLKESREHKYPVGNINTMQSHIFQIKPNFPKEAPGIMWLTPGSPLNIPYIPIFADINDATAQYKNDAPTYDDNSLYWVGSSVNDLVTSNRDALGVPTREKVLALEDKFMKDLPAAEKEWLEIYKKDKAAAAKFSTEKTNSFSDAAFKLEQELQKDLSVVSKVDIDDHWANKAILSNIANKTMSGTDKLHFAPNQTISRAEFVTILGRLAKVDTEKFKENKATDIVADKFYTAYMNWAVENNLVKGKEDGLVKPDDKLTREEMSVILAKYIDMSADKYLLKDVKAEVKFADEETISDWAKDSVALLSNMKLLKGKDNNNFVPKDNLTRAEVAQIIFNFKAK
ncbi:Dipeptidase [Peptoniphilus asaccharolyticus DSM 20463]|uniref:membrane dipeptidase n=1 Tax=Peptoniphilus asaccharolyticus DSM 20463 TaxID=573058 RepID=A0A1W1VDD5_PEPAS|nr:C69 family dipeptidase [Peptoniphilus asaccharolyticus]MBL7574590.1 C69 family dipeptidase [Peptoniphilus asaccharolyticus]SMB91220.1 Dipeptidase [Peptoniphilus asaccharolyticus DSM 20463]